jgi:hypothetical protein
MGISFPSASIGIKLPGYPVLARIPGSPTYYALHVDSNYFFYDGMYWTYEGDNWYAGSWYNGPWRLVPPDAAPVYVLRVPLHYYRQRPAYFHGWNLSAPPRWGEQWGNEWVQRHGGWDHWNRNPGSTTFSDGLAWFRVVTEAGCVHQPTVVAGRKPKDLPEFKWVNTVLGNLNTSLTDSYHAVNFRNYSARYLAALTDRFNRRFDLSTLHHRLLLAAARCGAHPSTRFAWVRFVVNQEIGSLFVTSFGCE